MRKLLFLAMLCPLLSMCQPLSLNGKVLNDQMEPIAGATVSVIRGTASTPHTTTNENGAFTLTNLRLSDTLEVSAVGYETFRQVLDFRFRDQVIIQLRRKTTALDDVVLIAYGSTTRRLNTGSVSRITAEDISRQPVFNPISTLEGRIPGLTIVQSSGVPGASVQVQLRGLASIKQGSEPLFIIDGVPFAPGNGNANQLSSLLTNGAAGLSPFNTLNPADIEQIDVLKDADATAIYGSRGANGVVLITTKKGRPGKTRFTVDVSSGFSKAARTAPMLNTQEYLHMRREAFANDGVTPTAAKAPDLFKWDTTRYTDFRKLLIGGTAATTTAQATLSGGSGGTTFLLSGGYHRETTVFPGSLGDAKGSFSASLTHAPEGKKYSVNLSASYAADRNRLSAAGAVNFINLPPNAPSLYQDDGQLNWEEGGWSFTNPLAYLKQPYEALSGNLVGRLQASYQLMRGLTLLSSFGYNQFRLDESLLTPIASQNPAYGPVGSAEWAHSSTGSWIAEPRLQYLHNSQNGNLEVLVGTTFQQTVSKALSISASGYASDILLRSLEAAPYIQYQNNNEMDYRYTAVYGRVRYTHLGRYSINLSGRRDGSSRFGEGRRFANFGAVGAAWIFSEEAFFKKALPFLSFGKLRGSYGTAGNDQIGDYRYLDAWSVGLPYNGAPTLYPSALYNAAYHWEMSRKLEGALELGLAKNRVLLTVAYYRNRSDNQLVEVVLPGQTGFFSLTDNLPALVQNKGWEVELTTHNVNSADFQWTTAFNISFPRNTLLKFPGLEASSYAASYVIGEPLSVIYKLQLSGVNPATGVFSFVDADKNGMVQIPADYRVGGNLDPDFFGGLGNTFRYKGWEAQVFFTFKKQTGADYLRTLYTQRLLPGTMYNQPVYVLDRWQHPGDVADVQRFTTTTSNPAYRVASTFRSSNGGYSDASFVRLKTAALSYHLPETWLRRAGMEGGRLYVQAQNLFTFTAYKGPDPETQNLYALPPLRTIVAGVQLTF